MTPVRCRRLYPADAVAP